MSGGKRTKIATDAFVLHSLTMRRSHAWRALSDEGRRVLARLELEHMEHGGAANGELACTYADFVEDGMRRTSIPIAIRQCVALGFLEITQRGRPSISDFRRPSRYRLTYVTGRDRSPDPTHEWRDLGTAETATAAAAAATRAPDAPARRAAARRDTPPVDIDSRPKYGLTL